MIDWAEYYVEKRVASSMTIQKKTLRITVPDFVGIFVWVHFSLRKEARERRGGGGAQPSLHWSPKALQLCWLVELGVGAGGAWQENFEMILGLASGAGWSC